MTGTEGSENLKQNNEGASGPFATARLFATAPNVFFLAYLVFVLFNVIRNTAASIKPDSAGVVIGYVAMLFIPFLAVAAYNLAKGKVRFIGRVSIIITAFFLVFAMVTELSIASRSRGRLAGAENTIALLAEQFSARQGVIPEAAPPEIVTKERKLAVPLKGSVTLRMKSEPMKSVEVVDPSIADVSPVSPLELRITGLKKGLTTLNIKDRAGYKFSYEVNVE